jgi:hypothetical protein
MSSQVSGHLLTAGCRTKKLHGSSGVTMPEAGRTYGIAPSHR